jgi:AraC-like DNA-binding protein
LCLVQRFSMGEVAPRDRPRAWSEQVWSMVGGLETRTFDSEVLEAEAYAGALGSLRLFRMVSGRHRLERTPALIERSDPGLLKIVFPLHGSIFFRQQGLELVLQPGQWAVYDTSQPYEVAVREHVELLVVFVPRTDLTLKRTEIDRSLLTSFTVGSGISQVLFRSLTTTMQEMEAVDASAAESLGAYLTDLIGLALLEKSPSARAVVSARETLHQRIERHINRHIADPELSIDNIAAAFGCTKRYLHKVFSAQGQTLNSYIWSLRLDRCAADLGRPENVRKPLTEVAFRWGFNHSAHFSRAFKERFGMPPRQWRARIQ